MLTERIYQLPGDVVVNRTQPAIGAVVSGINLAHKLSSEQSESLRTALYAHGVIFLRQQTIDFEEHLALADVFGNPVCDGPEKERPQITPVKGTAGSKKGTACIWHSDGCYQPEPPAASILRAIDPCTFGGDTCWSSSVAAYEGLDDELKEKIADLYFTSSLALILPKGYNHFGKSDNWDNLQEKYPLVEQPVVSVHPVTGARGVYANLAWSLEIVGMDVAEGKALIARLADEFKKPEYQTRWNWSKGDIAIWDNRLVQHYGVPDHTADRYFERITVVGEPITGIKDSIGRGAGRSDQIA